MIVPAGVVCAILAAGASRRLGRPKQLLRIDGEPLVHRVARRALASGCDRVAVVLGAHAVLVEAALANLLVETLMNESWREGIASSVRRAAVWAADVDARALVICTCDQPRLDTPHVDRLIEAHRAGAPLAASAYAGVLGVPALFDRSRFGRLGALIGDRGAADVLRDDPACAAVAWAVGEWDVDTPSDLPVFN